MHLSHVNPAALDVGLGSAGVELTLSSHNEKPPEKLKILKGAFIALFCCSRTLGMKAAFDGNTRAQTFPA